MLEQIIGSELFAPLAQAALGGFMLDIMNLYEDHRRPKSRQAIKDALYWTFFFVWPIAGVILAYVYIASGYKIDGLLAFTLGLTAPTVLQTMMQKVGQPQLPETQVEQQ